MLLRMPSPVRLNSTTIYLRQRVPAKVLPQARNVILRIPIGDEVASVRVGAGGTVKVSLRTADAHVGKARQAKALAYSEQPCCWHHRHAWKPRTNAVKRVRA